jgi:glyoxylase-like metal-dependent hydrolase (beta-lactamase superfamily II)
VAAQKSWVPLVTDPWTATLEYSFSGGGSATALAVDVGGGLLVASPPCRVADDAFEALAARAPVRALVATNAYHTLGLAPWKARFPDAAVFAPPQSLQRVTKVSGIGGIRPLGEAAALTGERVALIELPYFRTGEALIKVRAAEGLLWYVTDIVLNLPQLPSHPVFAMLFKLSDSAPGLRINRIAPLFMVRDRPALWQWLAAEVRRDRPRWLVPAHGDTLDLAATPTRLEELFRRDTPRSNNGPTHS